MGCEVSVASGTALSELRDRVNRDRALAPGDEESFEGFLGCLLSHKTGIGVIPTLLVTTGNGEIMLGLAEPAQRSVTTWLHRRPCPPGERAG